MINWAASGLKEATNPTLGQLPQGNENMFRSTTCTKMFIEDLPMIIENQKQPKCLPVAEWGDKLNHQHHEILPSKSKGKNN